MKFEWSTSEYRWTYGHEPKGRGFWFFRAEGYEFSAQGTYSEAKRIVKEQIKAVAPEGYKGTVTVKVLT